MGTEGREPTIQTLLKYCIICEEWHKAWFIMDDLLWRFECGAEASEEAQVIVDRNFGKLYDLEA